MSFTRKILSLAIPSLGSLLAEPLMVMADSAMVGSLGTEPLAGLTLGSSVTMLIVGMCIFLVYTTTAIASRRLGAGDERGAVKVGIDGAWLGLLVGLVLAVAVFVTASWIMALFGAEPEVAAQGVAYLRTAAWSLIGMMLVLAGTGALRGQLDARSPFVISLAGAAANVALNAVFIFGFGLGVSGAGIGTSVASAGMGAAFAWKIGRAAQRVDASIRPEFGGIWRALGGGVPLMIRTATMQGIIMATLWVAASQGTVAVAGRQIAATTWSFTSNLLDALAIAAQALVGFELGRGDSSAVRALVTRLTKWGAGAGVVIGIVVAVAAPWWPMAFSADSAVVRAAMGALLVSALAQPLAGVVYLYDGVLIGANDAWYLAKAGLVNVAVYAPALVAVWAFAPSAGAGLVWLWACYCFVFFGSRLVTLGWRIRTDKWMAIEGAK